MDFVYEDEPHVGYERVQEQRICVKAIRTGSLIELMGHAWPLGITLLLEADLCSIQRCKERLLIRRPIKEATHLPASPCLQDS